MNAIIEMIKADKRTTWLAGIVIALLAAGKGLTDSAIEPWGTCVSGVGGFIAGIALLVAKFSKPEPPAAPMPAPVPGATDTTPPPRGPA